MKTWQEVKESPNYSRLKDSLELRCARNNLLLYSVITVVFALVSVCGIAAKPGRGTASAAMILVMTLTVLIPATGFYLYRIFLIFHHIDAYSFTEVVLDTPRTGMGRDMMYFEIKVRDRFGAEVAVETHALFSTRSTTAPLEDYVNKKVLIGYNNATKFVAVIG